MWLRDVHEPRSLSPRRPRWLSHAAAPGTPAGEALGLPNLLLKRDDVHPLGAGGNKLRKLEFLLGAAIENGADTVITFGALQTNHGRQTAAACAKLGLRCELVLTAKVPREGDAYERSGNVSLDHLFGANVHVCRDGEETGRTYERLITEAAAEGREVATFPVGGSDGVGALGYVAAARELAGQLGELGVTKARLVAPHASGGTSAGLVVGTADLEWLTLDIACVSHPVDEALDNLADLTTAASVLLGSEPRHSTACVSTTARSAPGTGSRPPGRGTRCGFSAARKGSRSIPCTPARWAPRWSSGPPKAISRPTSTLSSCIRAVCPACTATPPNSPTRCAADATFSIPAIRITCATSETRCMTPTGAMSVSVLKNGMPDRRTKMKLSPKTINPAALPQARRPTSLAHAACRAGCRAG